MEGNHTSVSPETFPFTEHGHNVTERVSMSPSAPPAGDWENCIINPQLAFIVVVTTGGLMLCLLTSTIILACKVACLKRQSRAGRPTRSNVDLVSGTGYWGTDRIEGGIMGPCEPSLVLEEVQGDEEERVATGGGGGGGGASHGVSTNGVGESERERPPMPGSTSRDSCLDQAKDQEDTPLMV